MLSVKCLNYERVGEIVRLCVCVMSIGLYQIVRLVRTRACHILMFSQKFDHLSGNLRFICIETRKKVS